MVTLSVFWYCLLSVLIWNCSGKVQGFKVSEREVSWEKVNTVCQKPFSSRLFTANVKDELRRSLPVNEKFWIPAKSKPTNYFYWRGCHRPTEEFRTSGSVSLTNNSIVSCMSHTNCFPPSTIALKGDTCICVDYNDVSRFFLLYPSGVDQFCTGNLNDECGCSNGAFSLYQITRNTNKGGDCITQTLKVDFMRRRHSGVRRCENRNVIDSYRCWDGTSVRYFRNPVNLTWYEARRRCLQKGFELAVGSGRSTNTFLGREFWTEMRRTFSLSWTTKQGTDDRACVAVSKDDHDILHLTEESCSTVHKVLCEQTDSRRFPVYAVVIPIVVVLVVVFVIVFIVIFERRQKIRRKLMPTVNNRFYDQVVCSSVQTTCRGQTERTRTTEIVEEENIYHTIDDQRGNQRTYAIPFQGPIANKLKESNHEYYNESHFKRGEDKELHPKDNVCVKETTFRPTSVTSIEKVDGKATIRTDFHNFENHYDVTLVT